MDLTLEMPTWMEKKFTDSELALEPFETLGNHSNNQEFFWITRHR